MAAKTPTPVDTPLHSLDAEMSALGAMLCAVVTGRAPVTYVALGDSITQGYELSRGVEEAFTTQFSNLLVDAFHHRLCRTARADGRIETVA